MIRPLLVGLLVCLAVAAPSAAGGASADTEPAAGSYIVLFKADAVRSAADAPSQRPLVASTAADLARAHGGNVTFVYQHALKGFAARLSPVRAEALAADPRVAYVEPDQVVDALATQSPATWGSTAPRPCDSSSAPRPTQSSRPASGSSTVYDRLFVEVRSTAGRLLGTLAT